MESILAKCNKSCGHSFHVKHLKTDKLHSTIEKTYFNCPNCGREYVCFYTDATVRKLQAKVREIRRKLKWEEDTTEGKGMREEIVKLQEEAKQHMDAIKRATELHG